MGLSVSTTDERLWVCRSAPWMSDCGSVCTMDERLWVCRSPPRMSDCGSVGLHHGLLRMLRVVGRRGVSQLRVLVLCARWMPLRHCGAAPWTPAPITGSILILRVAEASRSKQRTRTRVGERSMNMVRRIPKQTGTEREGRPANVGRGVRGSAGFRVGFGFRV